MQHKGLDHQQQACDYSLGNDAITTMSTSAKKLKKSFYFKKNIEYNKGSDKHFLCWRGAFSIHSTV
jgi:hypothetical protein